MNIRLKNGTLVFARTGSNENPKKTKRKRKVIPTCRKFYISGTKAGVAARLKCIIADRAHFRPRLIAVVAAATSTVPARKDPRHPA